MWVIDGDGESGVEGAVYCSIVSVRVARDMAFRMNQEMCCSWRMESKGSERVLFCRRRVSVRFLRNDRIFGRGWGRDVP